MVKLFYVAVGGAAGSLARYGLSGLAQRVFGPRFPAGTLAVNVLGCLLIGVVFGLLLSNRLLLSPQVQAMVLVGVLGGLTTFSTFGYETFELISDGQWAAAIGNILLNNGLGLAGVFVGYRLAERGFAGV